MGLFLRLVLVSLDRFLPGFDYRPWIPLLLAVTAGFPPYLYGLLSALILLDEKDRDILPALRVTPLSNASILMTRIFPAAVPAAAAVPACLYLSGQSQSLAFRSPAAAGILGALLSIFNSLVVIRLSSTKVQALTVGKLLGTVLLLPAAFVLLSPPWNYLTLILPGTWLAPLLLSSQGVLWGAAGLIYTLVLTAFAWRSTLRSYFS